MVNQRSRAQTRRTWQAFCPLNSLLWAIGLLLATVMTDALATAADEQDFFESKIRPVLVEHCYACHSAQGDIEGGLNLEFRDTLREGGESGPAVVPKDPKQSLILEALRYEGLEMPPDQKLPDEVVRDFEKWIADGAIDPREQDDKGHPVELQSNIDFAKGRQFWSFQPVAQQKLPAEARADWAQNRIDYFVSAQWGKHGVVPSHAAAPRQLIRRLSYDLTGLPPREQQFKELANASPEVIDDFIEQLLESDSFGEHWARLWLDVMRYAEDQAHIVGNNKSLFFPNAYLYRKWVIDALNADMPIDQFIELQLAADLLTPDDPEDDVALGFIGLGPKYYRRSSPEVQADEWEDRVDVLTMGLLGLTVACARCHDHKYDPIGTEDYYALAGVFASTEMFNRPLDGEKEKTDKGHAKNPEDSLHMVRESKPRDLSVMIRGDVNRLGPKVTRGFLEVLGPDSRVEFAEGSGRVELARELVDPRNPLTARVFVNRVWQRLIGRPLVGTPSNFGALGERPTHPELLDDLALRFMENGWSLKWLCREIVNSATYRMAAEATPEAMEADPENVWLSRANRKRLSIEQWRDGLLLAAGKLVQDEEIKNLDPSDPDATRRTIFSEASRLKLHPMLAMFDYPDPNNHSASRAETVTAAQKLFLMNSPWMIRRAEDLAAEVDEEQSIEVNLRAVYRRLFFRDPTDEELLTALRFIRPDGGNLSQYTHALMMTNEVYFVD